jgi:hypothetical protein
MTMTVWEEGHYDYTISFALLFTCQLRFSRKSVSLQIFREEDWCQQLVIHPAQVHGTLAGSGHRNSLETEISCKSSLIPLE